MEYASYLIASLTWKSTEFTELKPDRRRNSTEKNISSIITMVVIDYWFNVISQLAPDNSAVCIYSLLDRNIHFKINSIDKIEYEKILFIQ